jgi:hypothetical protein
MRKEESMAGSDIEDPRTPDGSSRRRLTLVVCAQTVWLSGKTLELISIAFDICLGSDETPEVERFLGAFPDWDRRSGGRYGILDEEILKGVFTQEQVEFYRDLCRQALRHPWCEGDPEAQISPDAIEELLAQFPTDP